MYMSSKQNIRLGIIFAFVSIISASLKTALGHNLFEFITPSVFAFLEAFISFMVLVFIYGAMPEFHKLQKLSKNQWISIILFSVFVTVIGPILFYIGWSMSSANTTFLLARAEMLFALIFSIVFLKELVSWKQIIGIIIMFLGLAIIATEGGDLGIHIAKGELLILTACIFWGFAIIIFKKYIKNVSLELVLILRFFLGAVFFFLFLILTQSDDFIKALESFNIKSLFMIIAYTVISIVISKYCSFKSMEVSPIYIWSSVMLLSPVFALFFNYLILSEIPKWYHYIGAAGIIIGFAFVQLHIHKHKKFDFLHFHRHNHPS